MSSRRKILFSVHHLHRLRVEAGFPKETIPALHVCPDGLLFKDSFVSFDDVVSIEAPEELNVEDASLAGSEAEVALGPGEGCLLLRQAGSRSKDIVFLVRDARDLSGRLLEIWSRHRHDLPPGWRRLRDHDFSLCCPTEWQAEDSRHPNLRLRLFSRDGDVMMNLLVYEAGGSPFDGVVAGMLAKVQAGRGGPKLLSRKDVKVGGLPGTRLVIQEPSAEPPLVTDTYLLDAAPHVIEIQFLLPAEGYARACATLEKVAAGFRWNGASHPA